MRGRGGFSLVRGHAAACSAVTLVLLSACAPLPVKAPGDTAASPALRGDIAATAAPAAAFGARPPLAPATATPSTPPATPGGPPPFAALIKDARRIEGPLTLWQRDDKVWIELLPTQFERPFLLSPKIRSGIGEAWVLGGLMAEPVNGAGGTQVVEFVRLYNQVRLQARNTDVAALAGTPEGRAVKASYSTSLLGSTAVASQPHPVRQSVLIEANPLFLTDLLGVAMMLQRGFHQSYGLDRGNTAITAVRGSAQSIEIETLNHYYSGSVASSSGSGASLPAFLPDTRSMLVGLHYSLAALPEQPMAPRAADPRLGLFTTSVLDFSDDTRRTPRQRMVNRWRLDKQDPAAAISEPVKPITFWIDRNVPLAYRDTVRDAILEWNKAFEKIGLRNAIVVRQQPDDATFDTLDFGYASVRWMMNADPVFGAIGPSHVDPRSGEILDADIAVEGMSARAVRGLRTQVLGGTAAHATTAHGGAITFALPGADPGFAAGASASRHARCDFGLVAAEQAGYALDVLDARGEIDPDSPQAQQFVLDYVKDTVMHEVGHALGLRHNFRASRIYSEAQLSDSEFTRANGTTGSVMEYNAVNLARPGERGGVPFQTTLGPYDYWAIEYAYKPPPPGASPAEERAELLRIAARSHEPQLAYGTDEDNVAGLDPETIQLDLGNDPVAFAAKRLDIARDLFRRQETRPLSPERDYAVLRRSIAYALADATRAVGVLVRQIGGVRTLRDFPGSGRDPMQPVPAAVQRQALALIASAVLATDGLNLSPALQRRLAPDFLERADRPGAAFPVDYSPPQRLLELQRAVLGYLLSDTIAARVLDSVGKFDRTGDALPLSELYARLSAEVWSELGRDGVPARGFQISAARRELQREHVNRVAGALLRPSPSARVDARGLMRQQARGLLARLDAAQRNARGVEPGTRSHLADSADTLRLALAAPLQRGGL